MGYHGNAISIQHHVTNLYINVEGKYAEAESYVAKINLLPGLDNCFRGRYLDMFESVGAFENLCIGASSLSDLRG